MYDILRLITRVRRRTNLQEELLSANSASGLAVVLNIQQYAGGQGVFRIT